MNPVIGANFCMVLVVSFAVRSMTSRANARTVASVTLAASTLIALVNLLVFDAMSSTPRAPEGGAILMLITCLVTWVAVTASSWSSSPRTLSRCMMTAGIMMAATIPMPPFAMVGVWASSAVPGWYELRSAAGHGIARVYALYLGLAGGAALAGIALANHAPVIAAGCLVVAIAIRSGLVPFHSWLSAFADSVPFPSLIVNATPLLGCFLLLQPSVNEHVAFAETWLLGLALTTAVVAGGLALIARHARRAFVYVLMAESALVLFGLATSDPMAHFGAKATWLVVSMSMSGVGMALVALEARRGELRVDRPSGNHDRVPLLAMAFLVTGLAGVGLPGTFGFVAEDLLFEGAVEQHPWLTTVLVLSTALNGVALMRAFFHLFMGTRDETGERDLVSREKLAFGVLVLLLLGAGVWPMLGLRGVTHDAVNSARDRTHVPQR